MATEYIGREAAIKRMHEWIPESIKPLWKQPIEEFEKILKSPSIPAADVRPVVRGEWTRVDYEPCGHDYECSVCKQRNYESSNFCPNCGAIMRDNPVIIGLNMGGEDG